MQAIVETREEVATRKERTERLLAQVDLIETIYAFVANGGSLIDLCEVWQVRYSDVARFIDATPERKALYGAAVKARSEWMDEAILGEIRFLARFDIRRLYKDDGTLKNIAELDAQTARAVAAVEVDEIFEGSGAERQQVGETKKIKLWDKLKALDMAARNRGLVTDRVALTAGKQTLEELIGQSYAERTAKALPAPAASGSETNPVIEAKPEPSASDTAGQAPLAPSGVAPAPSPVEPAATVPASGDISAMGPGAEVSELPPAV